MRGDNRPKGDSLTSGRERSVKGSELKKRIPGSYLSESRSYRFFKLARPLLVILSVSSLVLTTNSLHAEETTARPQPNIVVLMTDDLGWQDVDCYDIDEPNAFITPRIDALASEGVLFWRAYSPAPTCAPSRCAVISGVHPARARKTHIKGGTPPHPYSDKSRMLTPWYSARTPVGDYTVASAMKDHGYTTGHVGKWHISYSEPKATELGFDVSYGSRVSKALMKNRLEDFATTAEEDPYRLDENGFPFNQTTANAIQFVDESKESPFFLYYATWLVHAPIQTRSEALLKKYAEQIGVDPSDKKSFDGSTTGQTNPFYAAMVEELDYNIGLFIDHLKETPDPRWPGHALIENTYLIFTSDNGGTEGKESERYTDNFPLDMGKTSVREGGVRVPFIVIGPDIPQGVETDVLVNGLDIYPTVLSMAGAPKPEKTLDGLDLYPLLVEDPTNPTFVKTASGTPRDTMMWHFPHDALESSLIVGDYKLIRNYDHVRNPRVEPLELYRLYEEDGNRGDIEEAHNLAEAMPEKTAEMNKQLTEILTGMNASYPLYNPNSLAKLPGKAKVPTVSGHTLNGEDLSVTFQTHGTDVARANLIYTTQRETIGYQEWFRQEMNLDSSSSKAVITLPPGTRHFYVNLIDDNDFLVSYPAVGNAESRKKSQPYTTSAIAVTLQ